MRFKKSHLCAALMFSSHWSFAYYKGTVGIRPQLTFNTFIILAFRKFHNSPGPKQMTDSNRLTFVLK